MRLCVYLVDDVLPSVHNHLHKYLPPYFQLLVASFAVVHGRLLGWYLVTLLKGVYGSSTELGTAACVPPGEIMLMLRQGMSTRMGKTIEISYLR